MEEGGREAIWGEAAGGQGVQMGGGEGTLAAGVRVLERVGWVMAPRVAVKMVLADLVVAGVAAWAVAAATTVEEVDPLEAEQEASLVAVKAVEDAEVAVGMEVEPEAALAALRVVEAGEEAQLAA